MNFEMTRRAECTASSCSARRVITLGSDSAFYKQLLNDRCLFVQMVWMYFPKQSLRRRGVLVVLLKGP